MVETDRSERPYASRPYYGYVRAGIDERQNRKTGRYPPPTLAAHALAPVLKRTL
jgi:hypothetical protein